MSRNYAHHLLGLKAHTKATAANPMGQFRHIYDEKYTSQVAALAKAVFLVLDPGTSAGGGGGNVYRK